MTEDNIVTVFDVEYYDEWLEIEDFKTIRADTEDEALDEFEEEYVDNEDRYDVQSVEESYTLNKTRVEDLLGEMETVE